MYQAPAPPAPAQRAVDVADERRLGEVGRRVRLVATAVVLVALVAGTLWGQDDNFPFGPFRMYAYANKTTGKVSVPLLEGVTAAGQVFEVGFDRFGLRRAEVEGQIARFGPSSELLALLARSYERFQPDAPPLAELRLLYKSYILEDGRRVGEEIDVAATWSAR